MNNIDLEQNINIPLLLRPNDKKKVLGEQKSKSELGENIETDYFVDNLDCFSNHDVNSYLQDVTTLASYITQNPKCLGISHHGENILPIFIKIGDYKVDLSVKVNSRGTHPCKRDEDSLNIEKTLNYITINGSEVPRQQMQVLKYKEGVSYELLYRCEFYEVYRMNVSTERRVKVQYRADDISFKILFCVEGCGIVRYESGDFFFYKGDCIFVPADSVVMTIHGSATFFDIRG